MADNGFLTANSFTTRSGGAFRGGFGLGSCEDSAAELRKLADAIENGDVLLQRVRVSSTASGDDWSVTTVSLRLHEKHKPPA